MILTKYACILTIGNKRYLFNTFNSALLELDDMSYAKITQVHSSNPELIFTAEEKVLLSSEGFLVEECEERYRELSVKMNYHSSKYRPASKLKIDVGITDRCNFACPYCFEKGNKNTGKFPFNKFTHAELLSEVRKYILEHQKVGTTEIEIVWYGGEPSLEFDFICLANNILLRDASEYGLRYGNIIVTNGYNVSAEHVEHLKTQNVKYIQITLDGLKDTHNSRRNTIPRTDSFETILSNVDLLLKNKIEVVIRINVDSSNCDEARKLLDFLSTRFGKDVIGRLLFISFGRVFGSKTSLDHIAYEEIYHDLYLHASHLGFIEPEFEANEVGAFCNAETMSDSLVIDFLGNKYKCWNDIFDRSLSVGNIFSVNSGMAEDSEVNTELLYMEKLSLDNFNSGRCLSCEFIKYCGGLCPYNRKLVLGGEEDNILSCDLCKKIVKRRIETHVEAYLSTIVEKDTDEA